MLKSKNLTHALVDLYSSEAEAHGYNRSPFIERILDTLAQIYACPDEASFFDCAARGLKEACSPSGASKGAGSPPSPSFSFDLYRAYSDELPSDAGSYSSDTEFSSIGLSKGSPVQVTDWLDSCMKIVPKVKNSCYNYEAVTEFLKAYLALSKRAVFHPENTNLDLMAFRRSKTIESIYSIGRVPFESPEKAKEGYSYFNLNSPFVLDAIQRIHINFKNNYKRLKEIPELNPLRNEIFATQAERTFTRFTSYKNFSNYRVTLNRHSGEIVSVPYNNLSSIEEIKPLRLFEKIASFIQAALRDDLDRGKIRDSLEIRILLIGHTEPSVKADGSWDQRELCDLANSLLLWYQRSFSDQQDYPALKLVLRNILNEGDVFFGVDGEQRNEFDEEQTIGGNKARLIVEPTPYIQTFYFDTSKLRELCGENDIIFLLDCPWLTRENYDFNNNGELNYYSRYLQEQEEVRTSEKDGLDGKKYKHTVLQDLNTNFNRITSSNSTKTGSISRSFRDDLIRSIKGFIENAASGKRKELYIFTSEGTGVDYSYIGGYPLSRTELYNGKKFTIVRFCNKRSHRLGRLSFESAPRFDIKIRLWSVLKYISVSYAFTEFREALKSPLSDLVEKPEQYMEFLRDVFITLKPDINFKRREVSIFVSYSHRIQRLAAENSVDSGRLESIKSAVYQEILPFIKALYADVIFADGNNFGDNFIRTAFEMNVYSSAKNVNAMLFLNEYRTARAEGDLGSYHITWNDPDLTGTAEDDNFSDELFLDKKLYDCSMSVLSATDDLSTGTLAMLGRADEIFETPNMTKRTLEDIIGVCEDHFLKDSVIHQNTTHAKNDLD